MSISEQIFLDAVTGKLEGMIDRFTDPVEIADPMRFKNLTETKGTLKLTLKNGDQAIPVTMIFNGEEKPVVDMTVDIKDWIAMQNKETTGRIIYERQAEIYG
jgi:hypothetical protein